MERAKRIALGMSGGVDSAVAAVLLVRAGYDVVGVTCRFHDDDATTHAVQDARRVCEQLGLPHVVHDCMQGFNQCVIDPFVQAYATGLTPSPCVGCNAQVKIPALREAAKTADCDGVATGHYARVAHLENGRFVILTALDVRKDQSYMLCLLSQEQLAHLILPLGGMTKGEVRSIAADLELEVAKKPESQDICFIEGDYRAFLAQRGLRDIPGPIVATDGQVLGRHTGLSHYTIGQRKGIGIAGRAPYYVIEKRVADNTLVVGSSEEAQIQSFLVRDIHWQAFVSCGGGYHLSVQQECAESPLRAMVKLRYRSEAVACIIEPQEKNRVLIRLRSPQTITAPGQYAVFYRGSTVLGGGMIEEVYS